MLFLLYCFYFFLLLYSYLKNIFKAVTINIFIIICINMCINISLMSYSEDADYKSNDSISIIHLASTALILFIFILRNFFSAIFLINKLQIYARHFNEWQ